MRLLISMILILGLATVGTGRKAPTVRPRGSARCGRSPTGITVETTSPGAHQKLERLAEPVYRFDDPARHVSDGTVWAWCRSGRPAALLTLTKHRPPAEGSQWLTELTSLAPGPISATDRRDRRVAAIRRGVVMQKFPKAPLPAEDATKRLRQMKELVRQIKAYEYFKPPDQPPLERYELRVLPQPVHRYADAKSGLIDGGMFIICVRVEPGASCCWWKHAVRAPSAAGVALRLRTDRRWRSFTWISRVRRSGRIRRRLSRGLTTLTGSSPGRSRGSESGGTPDGERA